MLFTIDNNASVELFICLPLIKYTARAFKGSINDDDDDDDASRANLRKICLVVKMATYCLNYCSLFRWLWIP